MKFYFVDKNYQSNLGWLFRTFDDKQWSGRLPSNPSHRSIFTALMELAGYLT